LRQWLSANKDEQPGVLIGGLALSFYARPRATTDIDVLFLHEAYVPDELPGFKRSRKGAFQENRTHVEIEVCTPDSVNLPFSVARMVVHTSRNVDGMRVASPEAMVVLKLYGAESKRRRFQDMADVTAILENYPDLDVSNWALQASHLATLQQCKDAL
jgi:hypothetical protein